ncbi:hypothetical protein [Halomonas sp. 25-S5]|uniref:hypothetical protein n=1 Tax=Halomonas sp. 25-S5 TaxID=2994065 RepID=UPI0024699DD6|nr:hypothetical protein [Halomonas sp. 25-S5]
MAIDPTTAVGRVRLLTGDVEPDEPFFDDSIYQWHLDSGLSEIETAIEVLESTINVIALSPTRERAGSYEAYGQNLTFLQKRLNDLKSRRYGKKKAPIIINAGQKDWSKITDIFGGE